MIAADLNIRPFSAADAEPALILAAELGLSPWSIKDYHDELRRPDSEMLVAEADHRMAGFLVGRRVPGSEDGGAPDAEIYNIGVDRSVQRRGVGLLLMEEFLMRCRNSGVRHVWLDVRAANAGAIRFYGNFGFSQYAVRRGFYSRPPDDGIIMRLELA